MGALRLFCSLPKVSTVSTFDCGGFRHPTAKIGLSTSRCLSRMAINFKSPPISPLLFMYANGDEVNW